MIKNKELEQEEGEQQQKGALKSKFLSQKESNKHVYKSQIFIALVQLFAAYYQKTFLYSVENIESNDTLYGGDVTQYMKPLANLLEYSVSQVIEEIQLIGTNDIVARKAQSKLSLDFVNVILSSFNMNKVTATVIVNLMKIAKDHGRATNADYYINTIKHIKQLPGQWYIDLLKQVQKL